MSVMDEWINTMLYIHTLKYYVPINKNEALIHVKTCMKPENIPLSERKQSQKAYII